MNSGVWLSILLVALAAILPVSSLIRRRIPLHTVFAMALVWVAIFLIAMLVIGWLTS